MTTRLQLSNRALQRAGARQISTVDEPSKNAREIAACFDSLRQAEMRRNVWIFGVRRVALRAVDTTTKLFLAPAYNSGLSYLAGAIVSQDGANYSANKAVPTAVTPGATDINDYWGLFVGPATVSLYDSAVSYYACELVYLDGGNVYLSLQSTGTADPAAAPLWDVGGTYAMGDEVVAADDNFYSSVIDANTGNDPTTDDGTNWLFVGPSPWRPIGDVVTCTLPLRITYPVGCGPLSQNDTSNIFFKPLGFLREANQYPKTNTVAVNGPARDDLVYENGFISSRSRSDVIVYRFGADISDPAQFDPLFTEGLSCRIGLEVCESLTQSTTKLSTIANEYKTFMGDARQVNGIEAGPEDPPEDDWLSVRL